ncbi:MAG: leukotoxin LktA family filamentous adhesin, partial [Succiniclasticum sp.]|uniref:leukotoxin LktA family filamentous adhesin n=1 Tax=Succiniclasticum sp. TaxID=2775030 RepID=UPI002A91A35E
MSYWNRQFKKHNNKYGLYCPGKGNDLSRQVLMALTAAGFFMTPFSAYASAITPANTTHSSTVVSNGNVHTVYVQEANGTVGRNRFTDFRLDQGNIANMRFNQQGNTATVYHLVNLVQNKIEINGTVNAIKDSTIGGHLIFASPQGIVVGASGVINAGQFSAMVPSQAHFDKLWDAGINNYTPDFISENLAVEDKGAKFEYGKDTGKGIDIKGVINANKIRLAANDIKVSGTLNSQQTIDFANLVNISKTNGNGTEVKSGLDATNGKLIRTFNNTGDVILTAKMEHVADDTTYSWLPESAGSSSEQTALLPNRFDGSTASIDVSGTIQSGGKVTLTADANTTFTEELGLANFAYQMGVDTASLLSYLGLPFDASVVIKTNTSKINVGQAARITSGGDMNVAANSKLKIKLNAETGDLYNDQNVKTTATLAMAKWTNSATVDVFGKLESTGSMALKADTNTDVSAVSKAATRKASEVVNGVVNFKDHDVPDKFVGLGFLYGDSLAAVRIHRVQNAENENVNQIVSGGTFSATANLKSKLSLDVTATSSSAPQPTDDAKMSTAIGIIVDDGDARVEIDKSVRAAKIDITAKNRISDTLKATNQLGEANVSNAQLNPWFAFKQPAITSGFRSMVSSGLGSLIGKAKNRLGMEEQLGGNEGVQGLSIFDDFHPGVSFAVLGQENTASVRIGETANLQTVTQTGITPDINITANVGIDLLHINSISGENNQKKAGDSNNNPTMMLDLAVGGSRINNSASVTLEGKAGAGSGSTPTYAGQINSAGKAVIKADAEMAYDHWDAQVDAWLSSWEKLGTSVKTLLGLGSDTVPGWQQKKQNLTQLEQDLKTWKQTIDNLKTKRENGTITQEDHEQLAQLGQSLYNNQTSVLDIARSVLLAGDPRQDMTLLKKAQDAYAVYKSLQGALRTTKGFLDPASYTNYYTRTTLASSNEQEGKMDLSGSLALHLLRNCAVVMAGEGTRITAAGDQQIHAGTKTNAISVTGSGGPYGTANSTTGAGAGVAASYQNMRGESLVVIGKNAELSGRNVAIDSGNEYAQRSIMYTAGVADKSGVTGMLNIMAGRSNSIVSVDDEARLNATDGNIDLQAKNDVGATGYAGGLTVGGTGSTATVGVGIDVISVDANTMAVVADNNINAYSSGSTTGMTEAQKRQEVETAIAQIRSKGEQEIASMTLSAEVKAAIAKEVDADENIAADQKATEKANREAEELNNKKERKQEEIEAQIAAKEAELARWKEEKLAAEAGYALTPAEEQEIIDAVKADTSVTEANREKEILRRQAARLSEKLDTRLSTEQKSQISDTIANEIKAEIDTLIRNGKLQESGRAEKTAELRQSEYYIDRANQLKVQALKDRNADDKVSDTIKKATALTYQILDDMTAAQYNRDKISRAPGATNPPATLTDEKNRIKTMVGSTATAAGNTTVGTMTARNVNVKAATDGSVVSLALEGAMVTNSDTGIRKVFDWYNDAGNSVGAFLNTNVERVLKIPEKWATQFLTRQIYKYEKTYPPSPNYPAQDMSDTSNHWTGVGSFAWNANDGNTLAVIDRSLIKTENLFLEATDDMLNVAVAGGGAMNWLGADRNDSYNVAGNLGLALNNGTRNVDSVLRKSRVENLTSGSLKSLSNIARKTGGDVSVGAGVSLTNASSDTQIDGGLSVSFNRSVNNTHAYLLNNTIANTGANGTVLSNYAFSGQNQFAGGINVELGFGMGEGTSYNVGGSAAYSELKNNVESGISGGSYTGMAGVDVEAVKSDKQKNIAVTASVTTAENSYGAGVSFAVGNHDNTARAFLQGVTMTVDKKGDAYVLVPAGKQTEDRYKNKTFYRKKEDGTFEAVSATNGKYTFTKKIQTTDKDGKVVTKTVTGEVTELYVRESNYDGGVRVEAGDAKNESHWQQHLAEHQLDPAGDSYFKYLNDKNYNVQKNDGGSSVWNIALGMEKAGTGGAGVGVAINAQKDTVTADLTGSQITASSVNGRALNRLDTTSVAVGAAVNTGSGNTGIRVSGSGAVSVNSTNNTNKVTFANNTVHADTVIGAAENKASILNVAVQVAAKANGAADGIAWAHNVMDNANGVYLNGGTYSQKSNNSNPLEVLLYSRNSAGVGVVAVGAAGSYGENGASPLTAVGSFALNFGANSTEAVIGNTSDQTILSGVHKLRVSASDEKMNRVTIAGAVDLANNASFGAGVSLAMTDDTVLGDDGKEKDKEKIRAEINNASITTAKKQNVNADITVNATDTSALSSAAVTFGLISAKDKTLLNGQAAASTVYSKKATRAGINNTGIDAWSSDASNDDKKGSGTSLITLNALNATDFYNISLAGALGGSKSSVGVGAAISTNRLYQTTEALYTNTAKPETISHAGNVSVAAQGTGSLFTLTSGAAASVADSIVEFGGSLAYNYINNVTRAKMSKVNLFSEDNIGVVAQSDLADFTFTGGFNVGGKFSAGASVNINSFNDTTEALVEGSNLTAKASGNYNSEGIAVSSDVKKEGMAQSWFDSLFSSSEALKKNRVTSHKKGLIIDSSSTHAISANLVCGGGSNGFLTFDGTFAQNYIDGKTIAVLSDTNVNEAENTLNANQNVHVNAADFNNIGTFEIGVAFSINTSDANAAGGEGGNAGGGAGADGGAGAGGGAEGGFFARSVKAIGTFVGNRWKNFGKGLSNAGSSISGSLGNGFMASVGLTENGNTINRTVSAVVDGNTAFTNDSTVEDKHKSVIKAKNLSVTAASKKAIVNTALAAGVSLSGKSFGLAAGVNLIDHTLDGTTSTRVSNTDITFDDKADLKAADSADSYLVTGNVEFVSSGAAVGASWGRLKQNATVTTDVKNSTITSTKTDSAATVSADSAINVNELLVSIGFSYKNGGSLVGTWGSTAFDTSVKTTVDSSVITADSIKVQAQDIITNNNKGGSGNYGTYLGVGANVITSEIRNRVHTDVLNSTLTAKQALDVKAVELRDISDKVYTVSGSGGADCVGVGLGINVISVGINQPDPKPNTTSNSNSNSDTQTNAEAADASAKAALAQQKGLYQNTYAANTSYDKLLDLFSTDLATGATLTEEQKTAAKEKHKNGTKKENKLPTGVHVNMTNSTANSGITGVTSVQAEEKNRVELTADALTLSAGNVAIGVDNAFLDLAHATDIKLDKSLLKGKEVKVGTFLDNNPRSSSDKYAGIDNVTYAASIAISPTTLISGAVNVVMNKVNITGTSGITVKDTDIVAEGEDDNGNVTIETNDKTKAATHLFGVAGSTILGVNTIWSWVQNTHTMGISFENTNANAVNTVSGKNIFVGSKNTTNLSAQGTGVAVGGVSVAVANTKATDNSSAKIDVINKTGGGTYKFKADQEISFGAYNAPELKADLNNVGIGIVNALVSYTTASAESKASVKVGDNNTFTARNVGFGAYVGSTSTGNPTVWADQWSFGIGGLGLGTAGENATAKTATSATVNIGNETYTKEADSGNEIKPLETNLVIEARNYASRKVKAKNIGGSIIKISVNGVDAIADAQDTVSVSAGGGKVESLDMSAEGLSYSDTEAYYFGVDLIGGGAGAKGYNYFKNGADATLSGNWTAERVTVNAVQQDAVDTTAEKDGGGVANYGTMHGIVDTTRVVGEKTLPTQAKVSVADNATIQAGVLNVQAKNLVNTQYNKKYTYQVQGNGAPVLGGGTAATSTNTIWKDATINIGKNASIITSGSQNYDAYSEAKLDNAVYSYLWGAFESADSYATTDAQFTNKVNVEEGATLKTSREKLTDRNALNDSDHNITLAASDKTDSKVFSEVHLAAALGIASLAEATNKVVRNNEVNLNNNVLIQSAGDINLYAGNSGTYGESVLNQGSYAEGYVTLINAGVRPRYVTTSQTSNRVNINSGAIGKAVENIDLQAIKGKVNVYKMAKTYRSENEQTALRQAMPKDSLITNINIGVVKVDGRLTSGQRNKLVVDISGTDIPNTGGMVRDDGVQSGGYTVSVTNGKTGDEQEDYSDEIQVTTGTRSYANDLAKRWEELNILINAQGTGNDAIDKNMTSYAGYVMEKQLLENKLKALGLMREVNNGEGGKTWIPITSGYDITYAELPGNLYASGGTVFITSDQLTGSGTITANNAASVTVNNTSNAYLKVNDIKLGEIGDGIVFNNINLSDDQEAIQRYKNAGLTLVSTSLDQAGIFINNNPNTSEIPVKVTIDGQTQTGKTYKPVTNVEIAGKIQASGGTASVYNAWGDIYINGSTDKNHPVGIEGKIINLSAPNGSLTQSYTKGVTNIAGSPEEIYAGIDESLKNVGTFADKGNGVSEKTVNLDSSSSYLTNATNQAAASASQGGYIFGDNVFITAEGINVNGLIQSGFGAYTAEVSEVELNAAIQAAASNDTSKAVKVGAETLYKVNDGGKHVKQSDGTYEYIVQVYYNPKTGNLVTENIEAKGGSVYLTGRIVSTGNGKIYVADGGADITVHNKTDRALDVGKITNDNVEGKIVITSATAVKDSNGKDVEKLSRTTYTRNRTETISDYTQYLKTESETEKANLVSAENVSSDAARSFTPEAGSRYYWTRSGESGGVMRYTYTYTNKAKFEAERGKRPGERSSSNYSSYTTENTESGGGGDGKEGVFLNKDSGAANTEYQLITTQSTVTNGFKKINDYTTGAWFWEKYYDVVEQGSYTTTTLTRSLKADHAIQIGFLGKQDSTIDIQSGGDINLTGNVRNTSMVSALNVVSGYGGINQSAGTTLYTNQARFSGNKDVAGISIDALKSDQAVKLHVSAATGSADASVRGSVEVSDFTANETAILTATGDITQNDIGTGIKASRIDIVSSNGSIGTEGQALRIYAGQEASGEDSLSASVNATAKNHISLKQEEDGDMRVGTIRSLDGGNIRLETKGKFVDALPYDADEAGGVDVDARVQSWIDTGLIEGNKDKTGKVIDNAYLKKLRKNVADYADVVSNDYSLYTTSKQRYEKSTTAPILNGTDEAAQAKSAFDAAQAAYIAAYKAYKKNTGTEADMNTAKAAYEQAGQTLLQHTKAYADLNAAEAALNEKYQAYMNASAENQAAAKTAWEAAQSAYQKASQNFKEVTEQQAEYAASDVTQKLLKPLRDTYDSKTNSEILAINLKSLDKTADIYFASEYDYVAYLQQKAKYKNFNSAEAYLATDSKYTELVSKRDNPTYKWTKEDLLYAVNETLINRETGSTDQSTKLANVSGHNITLIGENVGTSTGKRTITVQQLNEGDANGSRIDYLKQLANTDAADIEYYEEEGATTWSGEFHIGGRAPLGINATGTVNVNISIDDSRIGAGDITLAERRATENDSSYHGIAIGTIASSESESGTSRDVRILSKGGITNALANDSAANIVAKNLLLEGGQEDIGSAGKPLTVSLSEAGALRARSDQSIYISNFDPNTILNVGAVYAGDTVSLDSKKGIGYEAGDTLNIGMESYINAGKHLILTAEEGNIGIKNSDTSNPIPMLILNNPDLTIDVTAQNAWLKGRDPSTGDMGTMTLQKINVANEFQAESEGALTVKEVTGTDGETVEAFTATDIYLTASRNLNVNGAITATDTADLMSHSGIITVNGTVLGGQVYITTGVTERGEGSQVGNIVINNDVTANGKDGNVTITANVGDIQTAEAVTLTAISGSVSIGTGTGSISVEEVEAGQNISLTAVDGSITNSGLLQAGGTASLYTGKGTVTVTGAVDAQDNVTVKTTNGDVLVQNNITSHAGDISVTSRIGDIRSSGVLTAAKTVSLNALTSGEIYVNNQIIGKDIAIQTDFGDIETIAEGVLTATATGGTITVDATKGNIILRGTTTADQKVELKSSEGGVTVTNAVTSNAGDISITSTKGDITSSGVLTANRKVSLNTVTSGNINVYNQISGKDIEIQTANGNIESNAEGTLTATAEGGTITVGATQGNIVLGSAVTADQKVKIDATAGNVTLNGAVESVAGEVEVA